MKKDRPNKACFCTSSTISEASKAVVACNEPCWLSENPAWRPCTLAARGLDLLSGTPRNRRPNEAVARIARTGLPYWDRHRPEVAVEEVEEV